jgi:hypothetical protein
MYLFLDTESDDSGGDVGADGPSAPALDPQVLRSSLSSAPGGHSQHHQQKVWFGAVQTIASAEEEQHTSVPRISMFSQTFPPYSANCDSPFVSCNSRLSIESSDACPAFGLGLPSAEGGGNRRLVTAKTKNRLLVRTPALSNEIDRPPP